MKRITFIVATIVNLVVSQTVSAQTSGNFAKVTVRDSIYLNGKWITNFNFIPSSQRGLPNGVATLDGGGKLPMIQLPDVVTSVAGRVGAVTIDTGDIASFSTKVRTQVSSGSGIAYNSSTGVISSTGAPAAGGAGYIWNSTAGQNADYYINGTGHIGSTLHVGGNVGIGIAPTSKRLQVNGTIRSSGVANLEFEDKVLGATNYWQLSADNGNMRVYNNSTLRFNISPAGNVGIGTDAPENQLDIRSAGGTAIRISTNDDQSIGLLSRENNSVLLSAHGTLKPFLAFRTDNSERLRITSTGEVGIGTQTPNASSKLHVNGASFLQGQLSVQSGNITMAVPGSLIMYTGTGNTSGVLSWVKSTGGVGASVAFADDGGITINGNTKFNSNLQVSKLSVGASIAAPSIGTVTIPNGSTTATINTAAVSANSRIILTVQDGSGATFAGASVTGRTAGTSFSIVTNVSTGVTVAWLIVEPY